LSYSFLSGAVYSLVSGVIVMPLSQIVMFTVIGLMLGQYRSETKQLNESKLFKNELTVYKIIALIIALLLVLALFDTGITSQLLGMEQDMSNMQLSSPRLWRLGGIPHQ
jgi:hypothetical protein